MDKVIDPFMDSLIKGAQARRGSSRAILASDFHKYQMGVKIPHLMMEVSVWVERDTLLVHN